MDLSWSRIFILSFLLGLSACSSLPGEDTIGSSPVRSRPDLQQRNLLDELLTESETLPSPLAEEAALRAADMLLELGRSEEAGTLLEDVDTSELGNELGSEILVLKARLALDEGQWQLALNLLDSELPDTLARLPDNYRQLIRLYRSEAYLNLDQPLASAQERIFANRLLPQAEKQANHEAIWRALNNLPSAELVSLADSAISYEFQGWFELAFIGKAYQYNLDRQVIELQRWQQAWNRHPAWRQLPRSLQLVQIMAEERPDRIALLLPMKTPAGQVVRDGFMSAYYNVLEIGGQVPQIRFYDTTQAQDIQAIHEQAREDGAQMIIGPLQRSHVERLQQVSNLRVPTLALNAIDGSRPRSQQLYRFALSPENEARQIAQKAWQDGHRYAAILSPQDAPGDDSFTYTRKRESFINQWQSLGGTVVTQEIYRDDYTAVIENLLNLSHSELRRERLGNLLNESLAFTQRRRQDVDFIFLIAQPGAARQINPSLAYLYAGDLQVYATQDVYTGTPRPLVDNDLNGILFSESPWLLSNEDELRDQAQSLFPQTNPLLLRLQAFGVDAFRLYPRLKQLEDVEDSRIFGATGLLSMDQDRNIIQQFNWARFEQGRAQQVDQPAL